MLDAFRGIKGWQIVVLLVVLFSAIGGAYGGYVFVDGSDDTDLSDGQQLIPVTAGDLVNDVSINGSLVFPERESLSFGIQGTVAGLLVEDGQQVEEGQPLATLDAETVAALEKAVAQAEVVLRDSKEALADAAQPYTALDVAQAEAAVASARLARQAAEEALAALLKPTAQEIVLAEAKVANARVSLAEAQETLAQLLEPDSQNIVQAEARVTDAKLAVESAEDALDSLKSGPSAEDVASAQAQVDSDDTILANAQRDLTLARSEWNDKLDASGESVEAAHDDYKALFGEWLGIDIGDQEMTIDPDSFLESWGVDLASLFDPNSRVYDPDLWSPIVPTVPADDPATRWDEGLVYTWVNLYPVGSIVANCDDEDLADGVRCIRKEIDDTWTSLSKATDSLDTIEIQAAKAVSTAESAVTHAESGLVAAQDGLAELTAAPEALDIEDAERQLTVALATLETAQDDLSALRNGPDEVEVDAKRKQAAVAQASLDEARENLADLTNGADPLDLDSSRKQIELAGERLGQAEQELADLLAGPDPLDVALREADVVAAQASLNGAVDRLGSATLWAPWSGTVSAVIAEAGQSLNANAPVLEIVDPGVIEVAGIVDEIDVLFVQVGAAASITMDALPGQVLTGTVSEVASEATSQQGVVSFPITIAVQAPPGLELPEGLSAVANVIIREDRGVLLVPLDALYGTFAQPVVRVMNDGRIEERQVVLGNNDDFWVVIEDGLVEAELVVMEAREASTGGGFGALRGLFGGGGGGPGRGFGGGGFRPPPGN